MVCSRASLGRAGVRNEIEETFGRGGRDGGATYLLPVALDEYVFEEWGRTEPELAERVLQRVVADFRLADGDAARFDEALGWLVEALGI